MSSLILLSSVLALVQCFSCTGDEPTYIEGIHWSEDSDMEGIEMVLLQLQLSPSISSNSQSKVAPSIASSPQSGRRNPIDDFSTSLSGVSGLVSTLVNTSTDPLKDAMGHVADGVADAVDAGDAIVDEAKSIADTTGFAGFANSLSPIGDYPLGGKTKEEINGALMMIFVFVGASVSIVYIIERCFPKIYHVLGYDGEKRPALWVITLVVASYALLIPSLSQILFSFKVSIQLMGVQLVITENADEEPGVVTESMLSVVGLLYSTGSWIGAVLVVLYAIVIPSVKVVFLLLGEYWRESTDPANVKRSRSCIIFVQAISKWACPDMFAYILLLYLLRHLPEKAPDFFLAPAKLDEGFAYFSCFCVLSTFSSLAIKPPPAAEQDSVRAATPRFAGKSNIFALTMALVVIFAVLFGFGLFVPCMGLDMDENSLLEPTGPIPRVFEGILKSLNIAEMVNSKVAIWDCTTMMVTYTWTLREGPCILAAIMLAVFAIGFTCADMLVLALAAWQLSNNKPNTAMPVARVLGKIAMLDVLCMGVVVVGLAASMYKSMGVNFTLKSGIVLLISAEAVHYVAFWAVDGAVQHAQEQENVNGNAEKES